MIVFFAADKLYMFFFFLGEQTQLHFLQFYGLETDLIGLME